jgi:hypothetical protein
VLHETYIKFCIGIFIQICLKQGDALSSLHWNMPLGGKQDVSESELDKSTSGMCRLCIFIER